ncbi:MAG TPA: hypothetical protein PLE30_11430 [Candidatus Kapabacteria bacterium]|nr:hypothetical protein [Candidatus Kapabacteria bacterium]
MHKSIFFVFIIFVISCEELYYKFTPYEFKINSECQTEFNDSILTLRYSIQNLDTFNYYLPGTEIVFSGSADGGYTISSSPGNIYAYHNINFYPLNTKFYGYFEFNSKFDMKKMPLFYTIKPNESLDIVVKILTLTQFKYNTLNEILPNYGYTISTRFSIINDIDLKYLLTKLNLSESDRRIKMDVGQINLFCFDKKIIKYIHFQTSDISIDSVQSNLINDYLKNYIEVQGKLINTK